MKLISAIATAVMVAAPCFVAAQDRDDLPAIDTRTVEDLLGGKSTLRYPHPRDPAKFGDVVIKFDFKNRVVAGSNKTGAAKPGVIVLAQANVICSHLGEFGFSCWAFERQDSKLLVRFPTTKERSSWPMVEGKVE
jgi:hypothetical protein